MSDRISYRLDDGVATITIDDGKVNVMSIGMLTELDDAFHRAESERAIVCSAPDARTSSRPE